MNRYYENSGSLFKNDRRRNDKDPDFRGQATIDGKPYWLAGWRNTDKNGNAYLRIRFTEQEPRRPPAPRREPGSDDDRGEF